MGAVGSTANNLKSAIDGETAEFRDMYPKFIELAKKEKVSDAVILSFDVANKVEKVHEASTADVESKSIVFTSCATESNNPALRGAAMRYKDKGNHIITSSIFCIVPNFSK
ncbi:MAG: hypothetical protein KKD69_09630 [Euryarchaeota archaeon]|nr:hypothetical protein [Euryarchaeota archaeon]